MLREKYNFITAVGRSAHSLSVSIRNKEYDEQKLAHSYFVGHNGNKWSNEGKSKWTTMAMCIAQKPREQLIAISREGDVFTHAGPSDTGTEIITPEPDDIQNIACIDGYAYACGIERQVFKRIAEGKWDPMHAPDSSKLKGTYGFQAIAGFSESDIYAVGWKGEIWHYDGKVWRQIDSPVDTKILLNNIVCANDEVYISGTSGTLIRGRGDVWTVITKNDFNADIWGMEWFKGKLYVATLHFIYVLEGDKLVPVEYNGVNDYPATCYHLTSAEGTMWSIGVYDIFSFDGETWTRIE